MIYECNRALKEGDKTSSISINIYNCNSVINFYF